MSAWLHMGGAPAKTNLKLARQSLSAIRYLVRWSPAWNIRARVEIFGATPFEWAAAAAGVGPTLALLEEDRWLSGYDYDTLRRRADELEASASPDALARAVDARLTAAGVPARVGVFADEDSRSDRDVRVTDGVALAILLRRSGPLFMPGRDPQVSLVVPKTTTLIFPEESDASQS